MEENAGYKTLTGYERRGILCISILKRRCMHKDRKPCRARAQQLRCNPALNLHVLFMSQTLTRAICTSFASILHLQYI